MTHRTWTLTDWLGNAIALIGIAVVLFGMWLVTP